MARWRSLELLPAPAFAQTPTDQPPPPPPADTTTVVEKPDAVPPPPEEQPTAEPVQPAPTKPNAPEQTETEHVPQDASGFHLSTLETKNLSLLYIDPVQTYLTPYLARAFENALAFHEKQFHWKPWDRTTVLLKDFSDYGNAAALGSPEQHDPARRRAFVAVDGDLFARRALLHARQSRACARRDDRRLELARRLLAPLPRRQAGAAAEASGIDPLQFPDQPQEPDAALVHGRQRGLLRNLDGGRPRPRAGRL